jgi:LAO/AO transport system kinase
VVRDLRGMLALGASKTSKEGWKPPIVTTTATTGDGLAEVVTRLDAHWDWLADSGELKRRRLARAREEITALAFAALRARLASSATGNGLDELAARVADGTLDPFQAAEDILDG